MTAKPILAAVAAFSMSGCATTPPGVIERAIEAQARPTMEIDCPGGCRVSYLDPRDRAAIRMPTNGFDAAIAISGQVAGVLTSAVVPGAMAWAGVEAVRAIGRAQGDIVTTSGDTLVGSATGGSHIGADSTYPPAQPVIVTTPDPVVVLPEVVRPEVVRPEIIDLGGAR